MTNKSEAQVETKGGTIRPKFYRTNKNVEGQFAEVVSSLSLVVLINLEIRT